MLGQAGAIVATLGHPILVGRPAEGGDVEAQGARFCFLKYSTRTTRMIDPFGLYRASQDGD